jgi:hypothetical protein
MNVKAPDGCGALGRSALTTHAIGDAQGGATRANLARTQEGTLEVDRTKSRSFSADEARGRPSICRQISPRTVESGQQLVTPSHGRNRLIATRQRGMLDQVRTHVGGKTSPVRRERAEDRIAPVE